MGKIDHNKKHGLDSTGDHSGVSGAAQGNLFQFDAFGLPEDSALAAGSVSSHISGANPHSSSAGSGANSDISSLSNLTGSLSDGTVSTTVAKVTGATKGEVIVTFDGSGAALTTGAKKVYVSMPHAGTITEAILLADQSGSIVVDVWKDSYANFPPTDADSITASAPPTLTSAQKSSDTTLIGWTKTFSAGEIFECNIDSVTTLTKCILILKYDKTGT